MKIQDMKIRPKLTTDFRHWLIKLIAGKDLIVINAEFIIEERITWDPFKLKGPVNGGYLKDCHFVADKENILVIGQVNYANR